MIQKINSTLLSKRKQIDEWVNEKLKAIPNIHKLTPIYSSIDIRESYFKAAPVDINIFPSGFNNFIQTDGNDNIADRLQQAFIRYIQKYYDVDDKSIMGMNIALIVENFTRNKKYFDNVNVLYEILQSCGASVTLYTIDENNLDIIPFTGKKISTKLPVSINTLEGFDIVILNNDLSIGLPPLLQKISTNITPNVLYGWYARRKDIHLNYYNYFVSQLCSDINLVIDPWLISTYIDSQHNINFKHKAGIEELADKVGKMLRMLEEKYAVYGIDDVRPHVFIKANCGTFGMGIISVYSQEEILQINKKTRHSIHTLKQGMSNNNVVIQEGVPTSISHVYEGNRMPAEHIVYNIGNEIIGLLMRCNKNKSHEQNLNSNGMQIMRLSDDTTSIVHEMIAKISHLAIVAECADSSDK